MLMLRFYSVLTQLEFLLEGETTGLNWWQHSLEDKTILYHPNPPGKEYKSNSNSPPTFSPLFYQSKRHSLFLGTRRALLTTVALHSQLVHSLAHELVASPEATSRLLSSAKKLDSSAKWSICRIRRSNCGDSCRNVHFARPCAEDERVNRAKRSAEAVECQNASVGERSALEGNQFIGLDTMWISGYVWHCHR